jgi:ATP/ADP translocase
MDDRLNTRFFYGLLALLINTLACRPVIAIGWGEFLFFFLLIAFLLGPPLFKFIRRMGETQKREKKDK